MKEPWNWIKAGGVTSAKGFISAATHAGIKATRKKDMALVVSKFPASVAGTFTTNKVKAAPVKVSAENIAHKSARAVIFNSGNANACTGEQGLAHAREMVSLTAECLDITEKETLVCSTGRIGVPLPIDKITKGIKRMSKKLDAKNGKASAQGIMTSDTFAKECALTLKIGKKKVTIGGMAKGAGMIHPDMATMLGCVTTDCAVSSDVLSVITSGAVGKTFNRISVDGDTSTNDTVFVLANGKAGNEQIDNATSEEAVLFSKALTVVMDRLARMIVDDGESITHVIDLRVEGAVSNEDANLACQAICRSPLVKSSWYGCDPNWGRLMDVIGYSGCELKEEAVDIYYDHVAAVSEGMASDVSLDKLTAITKRRYYSITVDLNLGNGEHRMLVNDLTEGYVKFNMGE